MRRDVKNMAGQTFGDRVALSYASAKKWLTRCGCGVEALVAGADLRRGRIGSCSHAEGVQIRFLRKVDKTDSCWLWTAYVNDDGYGMFRDNGRLLSAHVWSYEHEHGPVPDGLELDHTCRVRACVNPAHLEPVTHAENVRRGNMTSIVRARGYAV